MVIKLDARKTFHGVDRARPSQVLAICMLTWHTISSR